MGSTKRSGLQTALWRPCCLPACMHLYTMAVQSSHHEQLSGSMLTTIVRMKDDDAMSTPETTTVASWYQLYGRSASLMSSAMQSSLDH